MYNLIIIDMQQHNLDYLHPFYAEDIINYINSNIEQASKDEANVIFVEFINNLSNKDNIYTVPSINTKIKNSYFIKKYEMDGTKSIKDLIDSQKLNAENFKVCGIFAKHCILATVNGLAKEFPESKIEIMKYGIDSANLELFENNPLELMVKNKNVIINDFFDVNQINTTCSICTPPKVKPITRKYKWKKK